MQKRRRRSRIILGLLALGLLTEAALTTGSAQAASGPGPYLAEPAWDRTLPAVTRFLILTNWNSEAVLDKETGLVWERSPDATPTGWLGARMNCANRTVGGTGRFGWRLPSFAELASLLDSNNSNPALPTGHPFKNVPSLNQSLYFYWSATFVAQDARPWFVEFSSGAVFGPGSVPNVLEARTWCVRGGMNADAY